MKKINKSQRENVLTVFAKNRPNGSWGEFRDENGSADYKKLRKIIFEDQGGLCAYCESKVSKLPEHKQRVEHYHSKSDDSVPNINWALDWNNVFGVCIGGSDSEKSHHPLPENLSCDAYKDHLIHSRKLEKACEGYILNPLRILVSPQLFDFDKATGALKPNLTTCEQWQSEDNQYGSTYDLVEKTIELLNLNCQRLLDDRLEVLKFYNQQIAKIRKKKNRAGFEKLAEAWFTLRWPSFFTTRRILLGKYAEDYLQSISYKG